MLIWSHTESTESTETHALTLVRATQFVSTKPSTLGNQPRITRITQIARRFARAWRQAECLFGLTQKAQKAQKRTR